MTMKYKNFLLIFNLLIEAESDKTSNGEGEIPDILITISAKLLQLLHNNIDLLWKSVYGKIGKIGEGIKNEKYKNTKTTQKNYAKVKPLRS